jgi:integrase
MSENIVPAYRRHKSAGRDRAYVTIASRRIYLGEFNSPESHRRYAELINVESPAPKRDLSCPTISQLILAHMEFAYEFYGGEKANEPTHLRGLFRLIRPSYGSILGKDFSPRVFKEIRRVMIKKGWSWTYIKDQSSRLKRFIRWCVEEDLLPAEVHYRVHAIRCLPHGRGGVKETLPVKPVADDVLKATLSNLPQMVADMCQIQRLCGCRPGELCDMTPIEIDRSGNVWLYKPARHKNSHRGHTRIIPLGPQAQQILTKYLFHEKCFGYSPPSYRRAITRACDRAFPHPKLSNLKRSTLTEKQATEVEKWQKLHRWSPNQLRHAAATQAREVAGIDAAQVLLGHRDAAMTQRYAEVDIAKAVDAMQKIG